MWIINLIVKANQKEASQYKWQELFVWGLYNALQRGKGVAVVAVQKKNSSIQSVRMMNVHTVLQHQHHHPMVSFINTSTDTFSCKEGEGFSKNSIFASSERKAKSVLILSGNTIFQDQTSCQFCIHFWHYAQIWYVSHHFLFEIIYLDRLHFIARVGYTVHIKINAGTFLDLGCRGPNGTFDTHMDIYCFCHYSL